VATDGGLEVEVWAWSTAPSVELLLNGAVVRNLTAMPARRHVAWPKVRYAAGELTLRAYAAPDADGRRALVATDSVVTTGPPVALALDLDQGGGGLAADGDDVALVRVSLVDAAGRVVRDASAPVAFALSGPGKLIGVANGDPASHEPDKAARRTAFNGLARAIVQSLPGQPGTVTLTASTSGALTGATVQIPVRAATVTPV
jgi:beta-galactosidase